MKKRNVFIPFILFALSAAVYGFVEYNRTAKDLSQAKAEQTVTAGEIIESFSNDEVAANKQYLGQVIAVTGIVSNVETDHDSHYTIVLRDNASTSSVRCSMDSTHIASAASLSEGTEVTIKGIVTGYNADETGLLGSDVQMNRCVIDTKK